MPSGPPPKRSDQRRRRNKVDVDAAPVAGEGSPELDGRDGLHPVAVRMWDALGRSGQSRFYAPSDWAQAEILVHLIDDVMRSGRKSAQMVTAMQSYMTELLVSEGARRRARLELKVAGSGGGEEAARVASIDDARSRLRVAD